MITLHIAIIKTRYGIFTGSSEINGKLTRMREPLTPNSKLSWIVTSRRNRNGHWKLAKVGRNNSHGILMGQLSCGGEGFVVRHKLFYASKEVSYQSI